MEKFLREQLDKLLKRRSALCADMDGLAAVAETETRDLNEAEASKFAEIRSAIVTVDGDIDAMKARLDECKAESERRAKVAEMRASTSNGETRTERPGNVTVGNEPKTYRRSDPTAPSWVRDMWASATNGTGADEARQRLYRNTREVEVETRALTTVAGAGGDFAPPEWLISQFVPLARAARPTADRVQNQTLPMGISSINIPKLLTGTATAQQATQNTGVQNTDATTGNITANIVTIAGQQVLSQQLIDQTAINLDDILLADLMLDYAAKVDLFVLSNNATNAKGLLQQTGTTALTYTSGSPTAMLLYAQVAAGVAAVQAARFLPPDSIIMHPRRWAAIIGAGDTTGRPIVAPSGTQFNASASIDRGYEAQGAVGTLAGLPVFTDSQIPINLGAGTNQDQVIVFRAADSILWEGTIRAEAFRETYANQLSVLLRVYNYAAFTANRFAGSVAIIGGTGLVTPTFNGL